MCPPQESVDAEADDLLSLISVATEDLASNPDLDLTPGVRSAWQHQEQRLAAQKQLKQHDLARLGQKRGTTGGRQQRHQVELRRKDPFRWAAANAGAKGGSQSDGLGPAGDSEVGLFEALRETIYAEVASLISQNESRPNYLIDLFRELQLLSSDYLRQRVLYAIQDLVNKSLVRQYSRNGKPQVSLGLTAPLSPGHPLSLAVASLSELK